MSRPLHAVFSELLHDEAARQAFAADPEGALDAAGHQGLPADLIGEAIVAYADTAPPAVAEHLAPFVMARSPLDGGTDPDTLGGLTLLASAPLEPSGDELDDELPEQPVDIPATAHAASTADGLDFGTGSEHEPATAEAAHEAAFDDALTEVPAGDAEPVPAPTGSDAFLGPDPGATVDDNESDDDLDSSG